jgi:hypothetical protein
LPVADRKQFLKSLSAGHQSSFTNPDLQLPRNRRNIRTLTGRKTEQFPIGA